MISLRHKFIFIHVPKTAGNSIKEMLKNQNDIDLGHNTLTKVLTYHPNYSDYHKVYVIRNPYDRIVSFYFYDNKYVKNSPEFSRESFFRFWNNRKNYIKTQVYRISYQNKIDETSMIRYENFEEDFRKVMKQLGLEDSLPSNLLELNTTTHKHYSEYLNKYPDIKELITTTFQEDLDRFGYSY